MSNLVYWYGAYPDPPSAYSFLANNKLISYEDGLKKGYDQLPKGKNKKVSDQLTRGLAEMKEDLQKEPEERCGRMGLDFLEVYMVSTAMGKHSKFRTLFPDTDVYDSIISFE